jgi:hypothetical protein
MKNKIIKIISLLSAGIFLILIYTNLKAFDDGIVGLTKRSGNTEGCTCHNLTPTSSVIASITGPSTVRAGDTAVFKLKLTGGPWVEGGCDISAGRGILIFSPEDTTLQKLEAALGIFELTHIFPKPPVSDTITWTFRYIAPNTPNTVDTLFATTNSVNGNGANTGDDWNFGISKVITITPNTSIVSNAGKINGYNLSQNYPNPFNPSTKIDFSLTESGYTVLKVYNMLGKEVATLVKGQMKAGSYTVDFSGNNLSSGVYFYKLESKEFSSVRKMFLVK